MRSPWPRSWAARGATRSSATRAAFPIRSGARSRRTSAGTAGIALASAAPAASSLGSSAAPLTSPWLPWSVIASVSVSIPITSGTSSSPNT